MHWIALFRRLMGSYGFYENSNKFFNLFHGYFCNSNVFINIFQENVKI